MKKGILLILIILGLVLSLSLSLRNNKNDSPTPEKILVMAAAGDIACDADWPEAETQCQQKTTAQIVEQINPDMVFALGDLHYTTDDVDDFLGYELSWGRYKDINYPTH
jgi:hypothetical protein